MFEESNIENPDCEVLILNFQYWMKIKWTKTTQNNNNSPIQDYVQPDDQTQPTFETTTGLTFHTINLLIIISF